MNKKKCLCMLLGGLAIVLIAILVWVNRTGTQTEETLYQSGALEVKHGSQTVTLDAKMLNKLPMEAFNVTYQRKVGPAEDRNYTGISISDLLEASDVPIEGANSIAIVSLDQYRIELPLDEALRPSNLSIVSLRDGAALSMEDGPYMLVIRGDDLSSRWVKQVVRLEVVD